MRLSIAGGLLLAGALFCVAIFPAVSFASSAPQIGVTSVEFGESSATLTAQIRPGGVETKYEFWLEGETTAAEVGEGYISASRLEQEVSADVTSLKPSHTYTYWVVASNSAGGRTSFPATFTTEAAPPPGCPYGCSSEPPYEHHEEPSLKEAAEREATEAPRLEAERQAERRQEEERPAREAAERAAKEGEIREAGERAGKESAERDGAAAARALRCVVPRLVGDSLTAARRALDKGHCRLGKVTRPRTHRGALVVARQGARGGRKLARGAKVAVMLGPMRR